MFLTSCTCKVKSRKRGNFHKSTIEKWLWRGYWTVLYGIFKGFVQVKRDGKIIWQEQWNGVLTSCGCWALWWFWSSPPLGYIFLFVGEVGFRTFEHWQCWIHDTGLPQHYSLTLVNPRGPWCPRFCKCPLCKHLFCLSPVSTTLDLGRIHACTAVWFCKNPIMNKWMFRIPWL